MLTIELDLGRVNRAQEGYLALGTRYGARFAARVMTLRNALQSLGRRFGQRQNAALEREGAPILADGREATLQAALFGPAATQDWPKRAAAILHGLHLPAQRLLPAEACCPGGPDWADLDGDSYLTQLDDGPPQARELGDTTALVVYLAPLNQLRILWIGAEADYGQAVAALMQETGQGTDWRSVVPEYADWLERACRAAAGPT
ncbi:MAG: hypothetical protein ACFB13_16665 [Kiloniellaceae bacterium]